jgi:hypothetical protein
MQLFSDPKKVEFQSQLNPTNPQFGILNHDPMGRIKVNNPNICCDRYAPVRFPAANICHTPYLQSYVQGELELWKGGKEYSTLTHAKTKLKRFSACVLNF